MATIECPECGEEVDTKRDHCPNCGYKIPQKSITVQVMAVVMIILLLLWYLFL